MSENYTAEDFARATLATRGDYMVARRCGAAHAPWAIYLIDRPTLYVTDWYMTLHGWVPVVESRVTEHTLRDSQENAARKREKLVDHIADQDRVIRRRNEEIAELRERCASLEDDCSQMIEEREAPLSLDTLAAAWEAAEQADECREGDVLIERYPNRSWHVYRAESMLSVCRDVRILSRAPREPWQDLADSLEAEVQWIDRFNAVDAAQALHAAGWRKGGDES